MENDLLARNLKVKSILVTLPKPETEKSPYFDLAKKYNLKIDFRSFIHVEGIPAKEVRKEKINIQDFSSVIFTSKNAIDHFFRICEEMRYEVPADLKCFCSSETIALYLQKYIQYRKRKIFFGKQTAADLGDVLKKHIHENFLYPCSDVAGEETQRFLQTQGYTLTPIVLFKTVCSDLSDLANVFYDILVFFSPSTIQSLFKNFPDFKQKNTRIAAFGSSTHKAVLDASLVIDIKAPSTEAPSMIMALENYIKLVNK